MPTANPQIPTPLTPTDLSLTPILDTHQHLIYSDQLTYSWTEESPTLAGQRFTLEQYEQGSVNTGIAGSLFMETSPDDWLAELPVIVQAVSGASAPVRGLIANCRPEDREGFRAYLDTIDSGNLAGLRRILHVEPDELSQSDAFADNVRLMGLRSLPFDLCLRARQLSLGAKLARRCEKTQFVVDHCGVHGMAPEDFPDWQQALRQIAELPNVWCKISGLPAYCIPRDGKLETVRPYVEHALEVFGWDRVVWGSDWPVCKERIMLRDWVEMSRELVNGESPENQRKLFHDNALRVYRVADNP
jgi:predicted TIM-barrel fold metal-dependent hydrolase